MNEKGEVIGPAYLTRHIVLKREQNNVAEFMQVFETSGKISVWEQSRDPRLSVRLVKPRNPLPITKNSHSNTFRYIAFVDCSQIPIHEKFTILFRAKYLDSFTTRKDWWVGMTIYDLVSYAEMRIVFPANLPYSNKSFWRNPREFRSRVEDLSGSVFEIAGKEPELIWHENDPTIDFTYRVEWDWTQPTQ